MKFVLKMECDNAAFEESGTYSEVARILRKAADTVEKSGSPGTLFDINGNAVGEACFQPGKVRR